MKKIKKWNWGVFLLILLVSYLGSLTNHNYKTIQEALVAGTVFTILLGFPFAIIFKYE